MKTNTSYTLETLGDFCKAYREGTRFHLPFSDETDTLRVIGIKPRTIDINPAIMPRIRTFLAKVHDYDLTKNGLDYVRLCALSHSPGDKGGIIPGQLRRAMNYHAESLRLSCDVPYSFKIRKSQNWVWHYLVTNPCELTRLGHKMFRACVKWDSEFTADVDGAVMAYTLARQINKRARAGK